ncbi:hypothetical protein AMTRI_Chr12g236750 [Amborella trichopoda]
MPMEGFRALGHSMEEPKRFHGGKGCVSRELRVTGRGRREKGWAKGSRFERRKTLRKPKNWRASFCSSTTFDTL